jgi:type III pantothenate kinase
MLLAMDIGNTNVKIGIYKNSVLDSSWRLSTENTRTADEYGMVLYDLLLTRGVKFSDISGIIICSVAPSLNYTIEHMCDYYMARKPIFVDAQTKVGIKLNYKNLADLGADRIVESAAAYRFYGGPVIVIDFGSATTFNAVSGAGEFLGGAIAPGIKTATESLVNTAAKLPRIELVKPEGIIGLDTRTCMQSGIVYGYAGLVKYLVAKIREQEDMQNAKVVATGGLSELIVTVDETLIDVIDRALALKGLKYIYELNDKFSSQNQ